MIFYHHGAPIQPSAVREGNLFLAHVCIREEDGEVTSLDNLGLFANSVSAFNFAIGCASTFVDGEPLPRSPFQASRDD